MRLKPFAQKPDNEGKETNPDAKYAFDQNKAPIKDANLWDSANRPKKSDTQKRDKQWLHGDYKDAPFLLTHKMYEQIKRIINNEK